jgi:hypothetical protein
VHMQSAMLMLCTHTSEAHNERSATSQVGMASLYNLLVKKLSHHRMSGTYLCVLSNRHSLCMVVCWPYRKVVCCSGAIAQRSLSSELHALKSAHIFSAMDRHICVQQQDTIAIITHVRLEL